MRFLIKNNLSFPPKNKKQMQAQMVPLVNSTKHPKKKYRHLSTNPVGLQKRREDFSTGCMRPAEPQAKTNQGVPGKCHAVRTHSVT